MTDLPPLYILRHGETAWNVEGRFQGQLDSPLTQTGIAQAEAQNAILRECLPPDVGAVSSTAGRARATAEIALRGLELDATPRFDDRLLEIDFGAWQGLTRVEIEAGWPDIMAAADEDLWQFYAPGGERLDQMVARVEAVLRDLAGPTVLITHGVTSRVIRCVALGFPPDRLADLPGGQGIVHRVRGGRADILAPTGVPIDTTRL
ncbi:MAG: histidine phosphatase family protein [Pseudomonadota bacterium]